MKSSKLLLLLITFLIVPLSSAYCQEVLLDSFESLKGWRINASEGTEISISSGKGVSGNCIRISYNFSRGSGYCGIEKTMPLHMPQNYRFTYFLKGISPDNNLEFKLTDSAGENVWWFNKRRFSFPHEWTQEVVKKRNISFAWGPKDDKTLRESYGLQFYISSSSGGKGVIYLDELAFEPLEVSSDEKPIAEFFLGNIKKHLPVKVSDGNKLKIDLGRHYEYGGIILNWDETIFPLSYKISASDDGKKWKEIYGVKKGKGGLRFLNLKGNESRYIMLHGFKSSEGDNSVLKSFDVGACTLSEEDENFFGEIARHYKKGLYPRYLYNEQSYWTISGIPGDMKKALVSEDGAVEVDNSSFRLEPFIFTGDSLISWHDVKITQGLAKDYLPIPTVKWITPNLEMEEKVFSSGKPGSSILFVEYCLHNTGMVELKGNLFAAIRPFQVNPPWQFLNVKGGIKRISKIEYKDGPSVINDEKIVIPSIRPDGFGASEFDSGEITEYLAKGILPENSRVEDHSGFASGAYRFRYSLKPKEEKRISFLIPYYSKEIPEGISAVNDSEYFAQKLSEAENFWEEKLKLVSISLPDSDLVHTLKTNLAYILISREGAALHPGTRSYKRSWIRDASSIASALLRLGLKSEVKEFINWYSSYQFQSGKIPCVVDERGPDPVDENDSNGEYLFLVMEYFRFSRDTAFLKERFPQVVLAVEYIDKMTQKRRTDEYRYKDKKVFFGLMPQSISHEGYSAKPMHSYWDDFFTLKGLKDAVEIAEVLGRKEYKEKFRALRDEFRGDLYNSIRTAVTMKAITYIPGCAELGDFDAASTAIAYYPCGESKNLPEPYAKDTFIRYYKNFEERLNSSSWENYTPYELRVLNPFIMTGEKIKAHEMLSFFMSFRRPMAWKAWAEVVWKDCRSPKFIGDMPHAWVSAEYINALRNMLAYETDEKSLVLGKGVKEEWLNKGESLSVKDLPTHFGEVSFSMKKDDSKLFISLSGQERILKESRGVILLSPFFQVPKKITVNGKETASDSTGGVHISELPSEVVIEY